MSIPRDVFDLVDRVANSLFIGATHHAREIVDEQRKRWEIDGRQAERRDLEVRADQELRFNRTAKAWFETADGLRIPYDITVNHWDGSFPRIWKRPIQHTPVGIEDIEAPFVTARLYEYRNRHSDGRPIYKELPPSP